jgi:hypothetical protein
MGMFMGIAAGFLFVKNDYAAVLRHTRKLASQKDSGYVFSAWDVAASWPWQSAK